MRRLFFLAATVIAFSAHSRQITPQEADSIASDFFSSTTTAQSLLKHTSSGRQTGPDTIAQPYYVFDNDNGRGFVIIAGDDRISKILGYSADARFTPGNLPPQLSYMLECLAGRLGTLPSYAPQHPSWTTARREAGTSGSKVLETACWGQGEPYNKLCPDEAPAGCVATAMAIVMKYHNWPATGRNRHKVNAKNFIDFSTISFNWELMDNPGDREWTPEGADEVAMLTKTLGDAVDMVYNSAGSAASDALLGRYLYDYFKYSVNCQTIHRHSFSDTEWNHLITNEIDNQRPIIYGGYSATDGGHEFVIDGYEGVMYHVNWGWDGSANGFFDINELLGFSANQSMVINIMPEQQGENTGKYSRLFVDKCYQSSIGPIYEPCGVNISTENIVPGEPFYCSIAQLEVIDEQYNCALALAIVDENGNVKDYLHPYETGPDDGFNLPKEVLSCFFSDALGGSIGAIGMPDVFSDYNNAYSDIPPMKVCTDCTNLRPTDRLQLMARRIPDVVPDEPYDDYSFIEDEWKIVAGTLETPTSIPVAAYSPKGATLTWTVPDGIEIMSLSGVPENYAMRNSCNHFRILHGNGICSIMVNGTPANLSPNTVGSELQIYPTGDHYDIAVDFTTPDKATRLNINMTSPGSLCDLLQGHDLTKIIELRITGKIDARDLIFIRTCIPYLVSLDLQDTEICEYDQFKANSISSPTGMETLIESSTITHLFLPNTLEHIGLNAISCLNLRAIRLPSSLKKMDGLFVNFLYQNNALSSNNLRTVLIDRPTPFEMDKGAIHITTHGRDDMGSYPTTLVVPKGAKDAYANAQGWKDFTEIIEMENPAVGDTVIDGTRYVGVGDHAEVRNSYFFDLPEHLIIRDSVSFNGVKVPVTDIAIYSFEGIYGRVYPHAKYITLSKNLKAIHPGAFYYTGSTFYGLYNGTIPYIYPRYENGVLRMFDYYYPFLYPETTPNYDYSHYNIYCPGGFIHNDDLPTGQTHEMWEYGIDSRNGIVKIKPAIDGIVLDEIIIDGEKNAPSTSSLYRFTAAPEFPDITVRYTLHGHQAMTTRYTPEFNSALPQSDLSCIEPVMQDVDSNPSVYSIDGIMLIQNASQSQIDALVPGLYIVRDGMSVRKILVH